MSNKLPAPCRMTIVGQVSGQHIDFQYTKVSTPWSPRLNEVSRGHLMPVKEFQKEAHGVEWATVHYARNYYVLVIPPFPEWDPKPGYV